MTKSTFVVLGTLALLACSRERSVDKPGTTTLTGASADAGASVEEVRLALLERGPRSPETLAAVTITSDDGVITLHGKVDDETTKRELLDTVRDMPSVKSVRDELQVAPKTAEERGLTPPGAPAPRTGQPLEEGAQPGSPHTRITEAVRSRLAQDKAAPAAVLTDLVITDDGELVVVSGTVPDAKTHDAVIKAAQRTPSVKAVRDDLKIEGR